MPRSSRRDSSAIISSSHLAQSFVITSCISQLNSRTTAFLAFALAVREQALKFTISPPVREHPRVPLDFEVFDFEYVIPVVNFHSLLKSLKSEVVEESGSCHVFYVIKTTPFLSSPSPLSSLFPSNTQLILPIQHSTCSSRQHSIYSSPSC